MGVESFGYTLRNDTAGLLVVLFLAFWRFRHTDFHSGYTSLHSHIHGFPFFTSLIAFVIICFLMLTIPTEIKMKSQSTFKLHFPDD